MAKKKKSSSMLAGNRDSAQVNAAAPALSQAAPAAAQAMEVGILMAGGPTTVPAIVAATVPHPAASVDPVNAGCGQQNSEFGGKNLRNNDVTVKAWSSLFKDNRSSTSGATLIKVTNGISKDKITFLDREFDDDCHIARSLIGYFLSKFPGSDALLSLVATWKHKCTIARHSTSWIVFTFPSKEEAWHVTVSCRDSGEPTLYVMRKPMKKVVKPTVTEKKKKNVNLASAPTDVWVEVGKKKTGGSASVVDPSDTVAGTSHDTPPPGADRVLTLDEIEAAFVESSEFVGSHDECDTGTVGIDPGDGVEVVMAMQALLEAFSTYPHPLLALFSLLLTVIRAHGLLDRRLRVDAF